MCVFFFFSSRRRHTRLQGDWSSDVCSSDLAVFTRRVLLDAARPRGGRAQHPPREDGDHLALVVGGPVEIVGGIDAGRGRSEERRGGEEGRSRWSPDHLKKKKKYTLHIAPRQ